jgi:hypothetical protein
VCSNFLVSLHKNEVGTLDLAAMSAGTRMAFGKAKHSVIALSSPIAAIVSEPQAITPQAVARLSPHPSLQYDLAPPLVQGPVGTPGIVANSPASPCIRSGIVHVPVHGRIRSHE